MKKINGFDVSDYIGFAYDGCHKIYLLQEDDLDDFTESWYDGDFEAAKSNIYDLSSICDCFENSCPLRFIHDWKLKETIVKQFEEKVIFEFKDGSSKTIFHDD